MKGLKPIETEYNGFKFRSRLEARWAVFFDACGVEYEYEPEGFDLGNGIKYLPDFYLPDVECYNGRKGLYVEVKGNMTEYDEVKIEKFAFEPFYHPILVVHTIPKGGDLFEMGLNAAECFYRNDLFFSFETVCGNCYPTIPAIKKSGKFYLLEIDSIEDADEEATINAYRIARQARFEHNDKPQIGGVR